jgi:hypothetical protein
MDRHRNAVFLLLTAALACGRMALAREPGGIVRGRVTDAESGSPLANTNVYLSSTTIGTTTGPDGTYALTDIPPGIFTVVASRVGHRVMTDVIHVSNAEELRRNFALTAVTLQGEEVAVLGTANREWQRLFAEFSRAFLGDGTNAPQCTLLNPEVLDFRIEKGTNTLLASTDSVLRIDNRALGYRMYARLGIFEWDVDVDRGRFVLFPRFEPFRSGDSSEVRQWRSNRIRSYRGSMKHFLASLVGGRLEQEGFLVSAGSLADLQAGAAHTLAADDFTLLRVPGQPLWKLTFDGWLRVDYRTGGSRVRSYITLSGEPAVLDAEGVLADPLSLEVVGDWTGYRVADMLPLN